MNLIKKLFHKHQYHLVSIGQEPEKYPSWNNRPILEHYKTLVYECKCGKKIILKNQKLPT